MRAVEWQHVELADHGVAQVIGRRLFRAVQQLLAVDDLHHAALVGAVGEIDAVALRAGGNHAVELGRNGAGGTRLLADQAVIADLHRLGGITEIVHFGHSARPPPLDPGDEISDAGIAFPPALMSVLEALAHSRDERRRLRLAHVPDLVPPPAERTQQIGLRRIALRQALAVAGAHHLPATLLAQPLQPGMCVRYFGCFGSVTSTIEVPLNSGCLVRGLTGFGTDSVPPWWPT